MKFSGFLRFFLLLLAVTLLVDLFSPHAATQALADPNSPVAAPTATRVAPEAPAVVPEGVVPAGVEAFAPYAHWQGSTDAYVAVPHDDALNPQEGATFEAWIFPSTVNGCRAIFSKGYTQGYWVGVCNGRIRFASGSAIGYQEGVATILPNVWTHIAVVWDPGLNVRRFFINGDFDSLGAAGLPPIGTRELRIAGDQPADTFLGFIAEARIWNVARDQGDIRRTMHSYLDEKLPGLVAAWPFRVHRTDVIGGRVGAAAGSQTGILFVGTDAVHPFPLRPSTVIADELFNALPHRRDSMGSAYLPDWDRLLLIGGSVNGVESNRIDAVEGGDGSLMALGTLPIPLRQPAAAFAPERGQVYVFGGSSGGSARNSIYAIDPATGGVRTLAATLPEGVSGAAAVYHPGVGRIVLLGGVADGEDRLERVSIFNPATETLLPAAFTLPRGLSLLAATYSAAANSIFAFGGIEDAGQGVASILEIEVNRSGVSGSVSTLPITLAAVDSGLTAVEDSQTKLIYLVGGTSSDRVWAFDPVLRQLWQTPSELPALRFRPAALYSPANRHVLLIGGYNGALGQTNVWKFPLGDGPAVKLGHWNFETAAAPVNDINGGADRVIVGTTSGAMARTSAGVGVYTPGILGGSNVRLVRYQSNRARTWLVVVDRYEKNFGGGVILPVYDSRILYDDGGGVVPFWSELATNRPVLDYNPYGSTPVISTMVDTSVPQGHKTLFWQWGFGLSRYWASNWDGCYDAFALLERAAGQVWGLRRQYTCGPRALSVQPQEVEATGDVYLQGLTYNTFTAQASEQDYGRICVDGAFKPSGLVFGKNGDLWVSGSTGVCRYPAASIPGTPNVRWDFNVMNVPTGSSSTRPSVDQDGRIWFGVNKDATHSGGLSVFEVLGPSPNRQSIWTTDYTWLNAPIGSKTPSGSADYDSSVGAVFANGERVWSARGSQIFTVSQRWQQLAERNNLRDKSLTGIWTVRGRLFAAAADELFILQPDGITWENWALAGVKDVIADSRGQIWVAATAGVRLYQGQSGWITPPSPTAAPRGPITALAADRQGRVWIGSAAGVTLYDRKRFVTTLAPPGGGAVTALLSSRDDMLWVGTSAGLARFDPAAAAWNAWTTANGLPNNAVADVVELRNGWLAISHPGGVVQYRGGTTFVGYSIAGANLPLTVDDKGRLWAGGSVVDGDGWQTYTWANSGLTANAVADNAADGADRVWFAHPGGGVSVRGSTLPPLAEQIPLITGISPTSGSAGMDIHILGSGFGAARDALDIKIGGKPVEIIAATNTDVTVRLSADSTSGQVSLTKNRKRTTFSSTRFCAVPVISGVTPSGGNVGVEVVVTGTNFDPDAVIALGGAGRLPYPRSTQRLVTTIEDTDASGFVKVTNRCGHSHSWIIPFNKVALNIDQLVLSQGLPDQPLLYGRPTLVQSFLRRSTGLRETDKLEIDAVAITFTDPRNGAVATYNRSFAGAVPAGPNRFTGGEMADISSSLNVANITPVGGAGFDAGDLQVNVELRRRGQLAATSSRTMRFERNVTLRVILVPIMDKGRGDQLAAGLEAMKNATTANLDDLRRRIMPTGEVDFVWSSDVLIHDAKLDLDSVASLFHFSHQLDRARTRWNDRTSADALVAFGVVDPRLVIGSVAGKGFWPDVSEMMNTLALDVLDTLCDAGNTVVNTVSFGLLGSDTGCGLDIPLYIAWAKGDDGAPPSLVDANGMNTQAQSSALFGHEIGHALGLVKPWAVNGSLHDNVSHSVNDEIGPRGALTVASKSCNQRNDPGAFFDWGLSFYQQPGVRLPVINAITGSQLRPQNDGNTYGPRAKAIMSYACARYNRTVFFEPADTEQLRVTMGGAGIPVLAAQANGGQVLSVWQRRAIAGERLHVSGAVNRATGSGQLARVELLSPDAPLSPGFNTGYWLVQVGASGQELDRLGIFPLFDVIHHEEDAAPAGPGAIGFFAATMVKASGLTALQLRQGDAILATFAPDSAAPQVSISSPTAGSGFASGSVNVSWTASDAGGDPGSESLEIAIDYSADGGATWMPVGAAAGSGPGTFAVPVQLLAGSQNARFRVTASDGFQNGSALSGTFTVAAQVPSVFISQPLVGALYTEAEQVQLIGGASDNQDGSLTGAALTWASDRDGDLGAGEILDVALSVGIHVLTLRGANSAGLIGEASVTVTVHGDYDGDAIPDAEETAENLNPLTATDALDDEDGDGLSLRAERSWQTDPNVSDSDGDGRSDGDELAAGTNPAANDVAPPADQLAAAPVELLFTADLSTDTLPAQQLLQVVSREPAPWTLTLGADWLRSSLASGATPAVVTIWVQPAALENGVHTSSVQISSALGEIAIPVQVTVINKRGYCDTDGNGVTDQADVDGVSARVGSQAGQEGYSYRYDLDRNGVIDQQDVALAQACVTTPDATRKVFLPLQTRGRAVPPPATATPTRPAITPTPTRPVVTPTPTGAAATATPTRPAPTATRTPTSTPTPAASADRVIYDDALAAGWQNWSWDATVNFAAATQVKTGSKAIAITHTAAWGGLSLRAPAPISTASYSAIRFWIYGHGRQLGLYTQPTDAGAASPFYTFTPAANQWTQITAPFGSLGNPAQIGRISVQEMAGASQPIFYMDDLRLVAKP